MAKDESLSLKRGIAILRLFSEVGQTLSLADVVARTSLSKTACHRMLSTLVGERFLVQHSDTTRYAIGPDLISIARLGLGHAALLDAAGPELRLLAETTGDVAVLHVLQDDVALCIGRHDGAYPIRTAGIQIGGRMPLHCGAGPLALLSFAPPDVVARILSAPLARLTSRTATKPAAVRSRLRESGARGYAIGDQDAFEYVVAVGAPIFNAEGLAGALAVGGIEQRYPDRRVAAIGRQTKDAADRISRSLGWSGAALAVVS